MEKGVYGFKQPDLTSFGITVDGQGGVVSTGSKGFIIIPYPAVIVSWYIVADQSGSIQFDIKKVINGTSTSIIGTGNKPILSSQQRANAMVQGWNITEIENNNEFEFNVDSASTVSRAQLFIQIAKIII